MRVLTFYVIVFHEVLQNIKTEMMMMMMMMTTTTTTTTRIETEWNTSNSGQ
jgi:hypothetical protein